MSTERIGPEDLGEWQPLSVSQVVELLSGATFDWWVAGGWAVDLYVGRTTRSHADIEVAVPRKDQLELRRWLRDWELWYVPAPGSLARWSETRDLARGVHELWCRENSTGPWKLEVLLEETADGRWLYRRDIRLSRPLSLFGTMVGEVPVIRPEIALLYKSKRPRAQDEQDLRTVLPQLDVPSRHWLRQALETTGSDTTWIALLDQFEAEHPAE